MTNHVHLLVTADKAEAVGAMMKALGQRYVQYMNKMYKRTGTLWEGRYKSCPTQAETYLLVVPSIGDAWKLKRCLVK